MRMLLDKIVTIKRLEGILRHRKGKKIVFTNGCFDILHYGHTYYLEKARLSGDILIVAINSDASVRRLKGRERPVNPLRDRMRVLAALESVDYVVSFSQDTPLSIIKRLKPDVLVKGGDWKIESIVGGKEVVSWGGEVKSIPLKKGRSSTGIIKKCKSGNK